MNILVLLSSQSEEMWDGSYNTGHTWGRPHAQEGEGRRPPHHTTNRRSREQAFGEGEGVTAGTGVAAKPARHAKPQSCKGKKQVPSLLSLLLLSSSFLPLH